MTEGANRGGKVPTDNVKKTDKKTMDIQKGKGATWKRCDPGVHERSEGFHLREAGGGGPTMLY